MTEETKAFTLGFISRILNKKIKNDISITGEIERDGCITAIGGLEYKLPGAKRAGVKFVFIPKENENDLEKIMENNKSLFTDNFKYQMVDHIKDVLDMALIENIYDEKSTYNRLFDCQKYLNSSNNIQNENKSNNTDDSSGDDTNNSTDSKNNTNESSYSSSDRSK